MSEEIKEVNDDRNCDSCVHERDSGSEYCGSCDLIDQYQETTEHYADRTEKKYDEKIKQLQAELAETKATLKHQVKCLKHCQAAGEQLRAELARLRWIPVNDIPDVFSSLPVPSESEWKIRFEVLEYGAEIPEFLTAAQIWLDEGSEVEWYRPIILPGEEASDVPS